MTISALVSWTIRLHAWSISLIYLTAESLLNNIQLLNSLFSFTSKLMLSNIYKLSSSSIWSWALSGDNGTLISSILHVCTKSLLRYISVGYLWEPDRLKSETDTPREDTSWVVWGLFQSHLGVAHSFILVEAFFKEEIMSDLIPPRNLSIFVRQASCAAKSVYASEPYNRVNFTDAEKIAILTSSGMADCNKWSQGLRLP